MQKYFSEKETAPLWRIAEVSIVGHSGRKGGVTYLLSTIDEPNPLAVYIRPGWMLGNIQDRYVMGGQGEVELCGRLLAGHCLDSRTLGAASSLLNRQFSETGAYWNG